MSLRDRARDLEVRPDTTGIGKLIADADQATAADVNDLLFGEPVIAHTVAAQVLSDEFGVSVTPKQVEYYRKKTRP